MLLTWGTVARAPSGNRTRTSCMASRKATVTSRALVQAHRRRSVGLLTVGPEGLEPSPAWLRARYAAANTWDPFLPCPRIAFRGLSRTGESRTLTARIKSPARCHYATVPLGCVADVSSGCSFPFPLQSRKRLVVSSPYGNRTHVHSLKGCDPSPRRTGHKNREGQMSRVTPGLRGEDAAGTRPVSPSDSFTEQRIARTCRLPRITLIFQPAITRALHGFFNSSIAYRLLLVGFPPATRVRHWIDAANQRGFTVFPKIICSGRSVPFRVR
jgi:hypothetical protein